MTGPINYAAAQAKYAGSAPQHVEAASRSTSPGPRRGATSRRGPLAASQRRLARSPRHALRTRSAVGVEVLLGDHRPEIRDLAADCVKARVGAG